MSRDDKESNYMNRMKQAASSASQSTLRDKEGRQKKRGKYSREGNSGRIETVQVRTGQERGHHPLSSMRRSHQ
eukprot:939703-Amphidinium_carterae.1